MVRDRLDHGPATLTKDAIARYRSEVQEQAGVIAARFDRLMEMEVDRLSEIAPPEPDSLLERAEAAVRQLKRFRRSSAG
jgi:predicted secreted protein